MQKKLIILLTLITVVMAAVVCPASAYSLLYFNPAMIESNPGEYPVVDLLMDGCNAGISGYALMLSVDNPTVATFGDILFPPWASLNKIEPVNSTTVLIQAADLSTQIEAGVPTAELARVNIRALTAGYATLSVTPIIIDDDNKGRYEPISKSASIVISGAGPAPFIPASK